MQSAICPACGAAIQFKSRFSCMTVCPYCQSLLVRQENNLLLKGKVAALMDDPSALQIGTRGKYQDQSFEIIGLLKAEWEQGFWNEWYILEDNGTQAWMCEALGFLSYVREITIHDDLATYNFQVGTAIELEHIPYIATDIKSYTVAACVGELPFEIQPGDQGLSIDCQSEQSGHYAYLDFTQNKNSEKAARVYTGKIVAFEALSFTNLREIDGW